MTKINTTQIRGNNPNPKGHINTLSDLCCYTSAAFTILLEGNTLNVYRERDRALIETVDISRNGIERTHGIYITETVHEITLMLFNELRDKYIFDLENKLQ
jgi:hypothetical protein